ncbi:hypothetical protein ACGFNU_46610 [Spirillospora sp. NPDC048911]|uniref:hypothetical protein n=1 Tax=Spirillospora sp. NPDC048911 TaxID=3364527 RepID=UPI003717D291
MLAEASPTGANILLIVGPIVLVLALVLALGLAIYAKRKRLRHPERVQGEPTKRGPVAGGIIEGDPGQRNAGRS